MVSLVALMITLAVEAHKGGEVAVINLPGAFLHAKNNEEGIMKIYRRLAKLMVVTIPQLY